MTTHLSSPSVLLISTLLITACSNSNTVLAPAQEENQDDMAMMQEEDGMEEEEPQPEEETPPLGEVNYRATITVDWTATNFPTNYPNNPHFSPVLGASHNEQVVYWEADGQPATRGIEVMAEFGAAFEFDDDVADAEANGYSQGLILGEGISGGTGQTSVEFQASETYPLITLVSMLAPSPDWFIGVNGFELIENGEWVDEVTVNLPLYDAGTDLGVQFSSSNEDSADDSLPITHLSSERTDTDFEDGVHFESGRYIATLTLELIQVPTSDI